MKRECVVSVSTSRDQSPNVNMYFLNSFYNIKILMKKYIYKKFHIHFFSLLKMFMFFR